MVWCLVRRPRNFDFRVGASGVAATDTRNMIVRLLVLLSLPLLTHSTCLPCCEDPPPGRDCCCRPPGCPLPPSCTPPPMNSSSALQQQMAVDSGAAPKEMTIAPRPNVLLFLIDDMGYSDLAAYGSPPPQIGVHIRRMDGQCVPRFESGDYMCTNRTAMLAIKASLASYP